MRNILWLASWYPNKLEPLSGDFIERHAKAASMLNTIAVIAAVKDDTNSMQQKLQVEKRMYNQRCAATIIYYKAPFSRTRLLNSAASGFLYFRHFVNAAKQHMAVHGRPALVHVHVSLKAGLVALYLKWFYKIPYVVTEHWSGLCLEAVPNFDGQGWMTKRLWKTVLLHAFGCSVVSQHLLKAMKKRFPTLHYTVIPNVVDSSIFFPAKTVHTTFRFLHVSTLDKNKNPSGIITAFRSVLERTTEEAELIICGPQNDALVELVGTYGIRERVVFKAERPQPMLAKDVQQADALVLYSGFETFGCVVIEANAAGVPVIVSDIPSMRELVVEGVNGVIVPVNDPGKLAEKMLWMIQNKSMFNANQIAALTTAKFGFEEVSAQFDAFYDAALLRSEDL